MRNKYNYGELVKVSGNGKIYGKVKNKLGLIIEKDTFYKDYYIDLFSNKKDWFNENEITKVFNNKNNIGKFQVRLCTTIKGFELINKNIEDNKPISNNKLKKMIIYKKFSKANKRYIIVGWESVYWPISNKSIKILEQTLKTFRKKDIPFKYIVMNEKNISDIRIYEFIENDNNVDVFLVERKIKVKIKK